MGNKMNFKVLNNDDLNYLNSFIGNIPFSNDKCNYKTLQIYTLKKKIKIREEDSFNFKYLYKKVFFDELNYLISQEYPYFLTLYNAFLFFFNKFDFSLDLIRDEVIEKLYIYCKKQNNDEIQRIKKEIKKLKNNNYCYNEEILNLIKKQKIEKKADEFDLFYKKIKSESSDETLKTIKKLTIYLMDDFEKTIEKEIENNENIFEKNLLRKKKRKIINAFESFNEELNN